MSAAPPTISQDPTTTLRVILVEDNPMDVRMFQRAAAGAGFDGSIDAFETGELALAALREPGGTPYDLMLLDLRLPGIDGFDVLEQLKADAELRSIPVIVFSSSARQADIRRAYDLGAAAYVTKPVGSSGYQSVIRGLTGFWTDFVSYPR